MDVTFLIGNGFDLNCGLHSSFTDICKDYCGTTSDEDIDIIKWFKEEINSNEDTWGDFEMQIPEYAKEFDSGDDFVECIWDFRTHMEGYLRKEQSDFFKDMRSAPNIYNNVVPYMSTYLQYDTYNILPGAKRELTKMHSNPGTLNVINYNYTNVFDVLLDEVNKRGLLKALYSKINIPIHIHGLLRSNPEDISNVTLGADNEGQFGDIRFELTDEVKGATIKPFFNKAYDESKSADVVDTIQKSSIICIYGMSLGESDLSWKKELKAWILNEDPQRRLIWFDYDLPQNNIAADQMIAIEKKEAPKKLRKLGLNEEETKICKDKIYVPVGQDIFKIAKLLGNRKRPPSG